MATVFKNILDRLKAKAGEQSNTPRNGIFGLGRAKTKVVGDSGPRLSNGLPVIGASAVRAGGLFTSAGASVAVRNNSVENIEDKLTQPIFSDKNYHHQL